MTSFFRTLPTQLYWLLLLALTATPAQAQTTWQWARSGQSSGTQNAAAAALAVDGITGASVVSGQFTGTVNFGGGTSLTAVNYVNCYVVRYDSVGALQWARQIITSGNLFVRDIAFDAAGNAYAAGTYNGTLQFGAGGPTLTSATTSAFVARYTPAGTVSWARSVGGTGTCQVDAVAVDAAGSVWLSGGVLGTVQFGSLSLTSSTPGTGSNAFDGYLARMDAGGTWLWVRAVVGSDADISNGLALSPTGDAVVAGYTYSPTVTLSGTVLTSAGPGNEQLYLASYSSGGALNWARMGGGAGSQGPAGVAVDATGAITVAGHAYAQPATFGPGVSIGPGVGTSTLADVLVVHYDANGQALWARRDGGTQGEAASAVTVDDYGDAYVAGSFQGSQAFGPVFLSNRGGYDALLVKYAAGTGAVLGAYSGGGPDTDAAYGIGMAPNGHPVVAGATGTRGATFGTFSLPAGGNSNLLLARLGTCPVTPPLLSVAPTAGVVGQPLALSIGNAQPGTFYTWTGPNLTVAGNGLSATSTPQAIGAAVYAVTAITGSGCRAQRQVTVPVAPAPYCTSNLGGSGCPIGRVLLRGTSFSTSVSTCQLLNGSQYSSYPATDSATATLVLGSSYSLVVGAAATATTPTTLGVWLDANQNGVFEASEYTAVPALPVGGAVLATLTVPATALPGPARFRIRAQTAAGAGFGPANACSAFGTGETRDYTLTLGAGNNASVAAPYCAAVSPGGCGPANLTRVALQGTTLDNASTCSLDATGNAYARYPATGSTTGVVVLSRTYSLQVSTSGPATVGAWVDWNHNNQFEASEWLAVQTSGTTATVALAVPGFAVPGPTRLRLRSRPAGAALTSADACTASAAGETEDYQLTVFDPSPTWRWARRGGNSGSPASQSLSDDDTGQAVAIDSQGNVYAAGAYWGGQPATFGAVTLNGISNSRDIFLVKYDSTGLCQWARRIGGTLTFGGNGTDEALALALDSLDNVYLAGHFYGTVVAGTTTLTTFGNGVGGDDILVAKYNPAGALQWTQQAGGAQADWAQGMAIRGTRVFVGGFFLSPTIRFGTTTLSPTASTGGNADGFVAALSTATGQWQWARAIGGTGTDVVQALAVGPRGELYAAGTYENTVSFGPVSYTAAAGATNAFVARLDPASGAALWVQNHNATSGVSLRGLAADRNGNLYAAGTFYGSSLSLSGGAPTTFGLANGGQFDYVLAKYSPAGALLWARQGLAYTAQGNAVGVDAANNVYVSGNFVSQLPAGVNTLNGTSQSDVFVVKFDASGRPLWGRAATGLPNPGSTAFIYETTYGMAVSAGGDVYTTGTITGTVTFPSRTGQDVLATATGDYDFYLARLTGGCAAAPAVSGPDQQACGSLTATLGQPAQPGLSYAWTVSPAVAGFPSAAAQPTVTLPAGAAPTTYTFTLVTSTGATALASACTAAASTSLTVAPAPPVPVITRQVQPNGTLLTSSAPAGNQWYLNGTAVAGATGSTYLATQPGSYTLVVTGPTGCTSTASAPVPVVSASRAAAAGTGLRVYPNPVPDGHLTVVLPQQTQATVLTLLNALGQVVYTQTVAAAQAGTPQLLTLTGLAAGVYVLRAASPSFTDTQRVVLQ